MREKSASLPEKNNFRRSNTNAINNGCENLTSMTRKGTCILKQSNKQSAAISKGKHIPLLLKTITKRASTTISFILLSIFERKWSFLKYSENSSIKLELRTQNTEQRLKLLYKIRAKNKEHRTKNTEQRLKLLYKANNH